jgi:hypothetical protein
MMQEPHIFVHTPEGLKMLKQQPMNPKPQGKYHQQTPTQQQASRHRAGQHAGLHPEDAPFLTNPGRPRAERGRRTQAPTDDDNELVDEEEFYEEDEDDDIYPQHLTPMSRIRYDVDSNGDPLPGVYRQGNVTHRYHGDIPQRRSRLQQAPPRKQQHAPYAEDDEIETERPPKRRRRGIRLHWSTTFGIAMLFTLACVIIGSHIVSWWQIHQDDATYGRPRTFQIDQVVGHNDSSSNPSHFIAINLKRHIIVIELPGGDPTKARIYPITTLFGDGQDLTPVTLTFQDVTGHGQLDMLIHIQDQKLVMINENGTFRPLKAGEHIRL